MTRFWTRQRPTGTFPFHGFSKVTVSPRVDPDLLHVGFDALPFEVALIETTGTIVFANGAWKAFGRANGAAHDTYWVGENYLSVCDQADNSTATTVADALRDLLAGERSRVRLEYPCHPPDSQRWFLLEATTVTYDSARYAIVAHVDITARKQAELQRDTRIDQLETIVSVLSHDLRNPLSIIRGYTEQLETTDTDGDAVTAIQESSDRMAALIDTTLEFARTQGVDDLTQVSLEDVAKRAWKQTPTADASLEIESSQRFVADEHLLRQVFENLFRNAVEPAGHRSPFG